MRKAEMHKPASIYPPPGRCPSWSPGNELKCTGAKGHEGLCRAVRVNGIDAGAKAIWVGALEVVADEVGVNEAPTEE